MTAVFAALARHWQYAVGAGVVLAVVLGCWWHGREQYRAGMLAERARWESVQVKAAAEQRQRESTWRAAIDAASRAAAAARANAGQATERITHEVRTYYKDRPADGAVRCLADERVRAANAGRGAIHSAAAG